MSCDSEAWLRFVCPLLRTTFSYLFPRVEELVWCSCVVQRFVVCEGLRPEFSDPDVRARVLDFLLATNDRFNDFGKLQRRKKVAINPTEDVVRIVPASILRSVRRVMKHLTVTLSLLCGTMFLRGSICAQC